MPAGTFGNALILFGSEVWRRLGDSKLPTFCLEGKSRCALSLLFLGSAYCIMILHRIRGQLDLRDLAPRMS
jgi:hypothetical protein